LKKAKKYGESFLTKQRFSTTIEKAEKSFFVWGWGDPLTGITTTSWVGIINGFLNRVKLVLVADVAEDKTIQKMYIRKKWWD
jgi:hypothetical protein